MLKKSEIAIYNPKDESVVVYRSEDTTITLNVRFENETVWLSQQQMAELFERDRTVIGRHIRNIFKEGELDETLVCAKFALPKKYGRRQGYTQDTDTTLYNLDVIISVGYRVHSLRGTQFRRWANTILKDYLLKGYAINQRMAMMEQRIDNRLQEHTEQIHELQQKVDFFVRTSLPPVEGIFFDGQIFDAYTFACGLIREAKKRIELIDNYVDDSILTLLDKRRRGILATIYTFAITPQLKLDLEKHNAQYAPIEVQKFTRSHDRFLCIDDTVYHIGASLKDLGKKWFAFSRMEITTDELLANMKQEKLQF